MKNLFVRVQRAIDSESGQALGEYSLVLAFIFVVCVAALTLMGVAILTPLENLLTGFA